MIEILQFVFSSFFKFIGTIILIYSIGECVEAIVRQIKK